MFLFLFFISSKARSSGLLSAMDGAKEVFVEKPRVVKIDKSENGYGFFLKMNKVYHLLFHAVIFNFKAKLGFTSLKICVYFVCLLQLIFGFVYANC